MTDRAEPDTLDESRFNTPPHLDRVVAASRKRLFAVFDDPQQGRDAIAAEQVLALLSRGEPWSFYGEEGRRRLDAGGTRHGVRGRFVRLVQTTMTDDNLYLDALARALEAGALVVAVPVGSITTADRVAELLQHAGGHAFAYTAHFDLVPTLGEI